MDEPNNTERKSPKSIAAIIIVCVLVLTAGGYFFFFRPAQIKKDCHALAAEKAKGAGYSIDSPSGYGRNRISTSNETYLANYAGCMHRNGL